jgi:NADPH2:quinone reductase
MQAIRVERNGGPQVMRLVDGSPPTPASTEVLVRVEAAGVNFIDIYYRSGAYARELPFGLGEEGAGTVESVGQTVTELAVGDRVAWATVPGSYATHVVASTDQLVPVPKGVSARQAAAVMLQGMTADYLTRSTFRLEAGHSCLVHAAAGGVGLLLVQMARQAGARVFGTTSTEAKAQLALQEGADEVFPPDSAFDESIRAATGGRGVDVVYDSIGAATFDRSLRSLRQRGLLVLFGQSSGRVPPLDLQVLNARGSLYVTRPTLRHYIPARPDLLDRAQRVLAATARGELRVHIHSEVPLARALEAHTALESRATTGKVLLIP